MSHIYRVAELNTSHRENIENHPILNKIYDILAKLHKLGKQIGKHIGIEEIKRQTRQQNK